MRVVVIQTIILITYTTLLLETNQLPIKIKRSPLELGYVSFTDGHNKHPSRFPALFHHLNTSTMHKIPASVKQAVQKVNTRSHILHEWIPGRVRQHAFIPGHIHHMLIPAHELLLASAVLVPETNKLEIYEPYRSHYGGFGVGLNFGGRGAGHGFHVLF